MIKTARTLLCAFVALVLAMPAMAQQKTGTGEYAIRPDMNFRPKAKHTLWYTLPATAHNISNQWEEFTEEGQYAFSDFKKSLDTFHTIRL